MSDTADPTGFEGTRVNGQPSSTAPDGTARDVALPYAGFTWAEGAIIAGVCVLFTALMFVTALMSSCCAPSSRAEMMRGIFGRLSYLVLWALSAVPVFWACVRLRPRRVGWSRALAGHLLLAFLVAFAVEISQNNIFTGIAAIWPPSDSPDLSLGPAAVLSSLQFLGELVPYVIVLGIGLGRYEYLMSRKRRAEAERLEREAERLRAQLTAAQLAALRMQINPHFLFNTLHTISTMAGSHPEGVRKATARLSEMLRYALSTVDEQEVPLEKEVDMLESYLQIQKLRLDERLETHLEIEPGVRPALVPTLLLQPLAENAVKHGFQGSTAPGRLDVRIWRDEDDLVLRVADNGAGHSDAADAIAAAEAAVHSGDEHGLQNIAQRLEGLYGDEATLRFERSERGGIAVVIRLPFHTRTAERNLRVAAVAAK